MKLSPRTLAASGIAAFAIVFLIIFFESSPAPREGTDVVLSQREYAEQVAAAEKPAAAPAPAVTPVPTLEEPEVRGEGQPRETFAPTPRPTLPPDAQPRSYFVLDFGKDSALPPEYALSGVEMTDRGIALSADAEKDEEGYRTGTFESPVQPFDFPVNSFAPLWKQDTPEGTALTMEYAVSADGSDWSEWYEFTPEEGEINETYPDGSPNPNYGYTAGGIIHFADPVKDYFRFRVTLGSDNEETPVLEGMRLYYQDTTLVDRGS